MLVAVEHLKLEIRGVPVLHDVGLHMDGGQVYGLLGPNGAGKSSTLSVVTGLRPASGGRVAVAGRDPWRERVAAHREIGVLPEQMGFYGWMSAPDYLTWFAALYGRTLSRKDAAERMAQVGLDGKDRRAIDTYSRGMKQRLGLARALVNDPRLLILDEPTNGLDPRGRREIHDRLLELTRNAGVGILLCTHLLDDVERLCSRIGIIHEGRTVLEGDLAKLVSGGTGGLEALYLSHTGAGTPA
jgi:ABC-2 type transport system ATP-binding protein